MKNITCHIAIIGCGLGGLAAAIALRRQGHNVTMIEQAAQLSQIGAGIQIPPNAARILQSWGLLEAIRACSIEPERLILREHRRGAVLCEPKLVPEMEEAYGAPWLLIHRADYQKVLVDEAERLGIVIRLGCAVTQIGCSGAPVLVSVSAGADIPADVVLGADGIHSRCREMVQESAEPQLVTKGFVHRILITDDDVDAHPDLATLLRTPVTHTWMGPGAHVASYPLKDSNTYNFVFICSTQLPTLNDMKIHFPNWDPRLLSVLNIAHEVKQWPLTASVGNERWIHPVANVALLGDACHAMFPYLAQGAAQAVEDGAVLGALFSRLQQAVEIRDALLTYEQLRQPRTTKVRERSAENAQIFHMLESGDGQEGDWRVEIARALGGEHRGWAEDGFRKWLFGVDVVGEAEERVRRR